MLIATGESFQLPHDGWGMFFLMPLRPPPIEGFFDCCMMVGEEGSSSGSRPVEGVSTTARWSGIPLHPHSLMLFVTIRGLWPLRDGWRSIFIFTLSGIPPPKVGLGENLHLQVLVLATGGGCNCRKMDRDPFLSLCSRALRHHKGSCHLCKMAVDLSSSLRLRARCHQREASITVQLLGIHHLLHARLMSMLITSLCH